MFGGGDATVASTIHPAAPPYPASPEIAACNAAPITLAAASTSACADTLLVQTHSSNERNAAPNAVPSSSQASRRSRASLAVEGLTDKTNQPTMTANGNTNGSVKDKAAAAAAPAVERSGVESRKGPVVFTDGNGHTASDATERVVAHPASPASRLVSGQGGRVGYASSLCRKPSVQAPPSGAAPLDRAHSHVSAFSPLSPASPSFAGHGGLTTAVLVAELLHVPDGYYSTGQLTSASHAFFPPSFIGAMGLIGEATPGWPQAATTTRSAAAAAGGLSRNDSTTGLHGRSLSAGTSRAKEPVTAAGFISSPACTYAALEDRVRRAAQAFESDAQSASPAPSQLLARVNVSVCGSSISSSSRCSYPCCGGVDEDNEVQVARGYRTMTSPSSYDSEGRSAKQTLGSRGHAVSIMEDGGESEESGGGSSINNNSGGVVSLRIGAKRPRSSAPHALYTAGQAVGAATHATVPGIRDGPSSPSPALPRIAAAPSAVTRSPSGSPARGANADSATASLASPFCALLDVFTEDLAGEVPAKTTASTTSAVAPSGERRFTLTSSPAASLLREPWLRLLAGRCLSRQLAAQLQRDADVWSVVMSSDSGEDARSRAGHVRAATAGPAAAGEYVRVVAASEASSVPRRPLSVPSATSADNAALGPPRTLYEALLQLFSLLEQWERSVVDLSAAAAAATSSRGRTTRAVSPAQQQQQQQQQQQTSKSTFPASPPPNVKEMLAPVVRQWCDVLLLRWPGELISLGYLDWWMRHPVWENLTRGAPSGDVSNVGKSAGADIMEEEMANMTGHRTASRAPAAGQQQQQQVQLLREALVAASRDGMRCLFEAIVDAFISSVQELLRCCTSGTRRPTSTYRFSEQHSRRSAEGSRSDDKAATTRYTAAATRCQGLLRVLTSLYLDTPGTLRHVLGDFTAATTAAAAVAGSSTSSLHTPSSPLSATLVGRGRGQRSTDNNNNAGDNKGNANEDTSGAPGKGGNERSRGSPASPLNAKAFTTASTTATTATTTAGQTSFGPEQQQQQQQHQQQQVHRHSDERTRARQLHYQLLYAVCRLCNELPLTWSTALADRSATESDGQTVRDAWAARLTGLPSSSWPPSPSSSSSLPTSAASMFCLFSPHRAVDHGEMFAAGVQLAAAIAIPLSTVQLPMKGDLLCLTSRLSRQRSTLLRRGWLSEREFGVCAGHLSTLQAHAT